MPCINAQRHYPHRHPARLGSPLTTATNAIHPTSDSLPSEAPLPMHSHLQQLPTHPTSKLPIKHPHTQLAKPANLPPSSNRCHVAPSPTFDSSHCRNGLQKHPVWAPMIFAMHLLSRHYPTHPSYCLKTPQRSNWQGTPKHPPSKSSHEWAGWNGNGLGCLGMRNT